MNGTDYFKIICIAGFLLLGAVSCWATAESLHLLLPSWPVMFCWGITIAFFVIASWGTKLIADACNQNVYVENRTTSLWIGVGIVLIFWLICSMPTNTHTFFYRNLINEKVTTDLKTTQTYLAQIKDGKVTDERINESIQELSNRVDLLLGQLEAEIKNEANPGNGPRAKAVLVDLAKVLGIAEVKPLSFVGTSVKEREVLCQQYRNMVFKLKEAKEQSIRRTMTPANQNYRKEAERAYKNLEVVRKGIENKSLDVEDANDVQEVCNKLNEGYATVKAHKQFVNFDSPESEAIYTAQDPKTKVSRLLSVFDVWADFVTGKEGGLSFIFWILISILIDVAAFVFFDIAFKKKD